MRQQHNVKIDSTDLVLIKKISKSRGEDSSDFIRLSIKKELARMGFLSEYERKVLGVVK